MTGSIDFGYPWWLAYGHIVFLIPAAALLAAALIRAWPKWIAVIGGAVTLWAGASLFIMNSFEINRAPSLPTENFFRSGQGRVLDIGAGTGRSSIMVLTARPQAKLVALDLFSQSFDQHFGKAESVTPQQRLMANLKAAGVDGRASIETADMRKLPFEPSSFDAIVSAYAVDHVGREGAKQVLTESNRVLKPGGDFLLILVGNDAWTKFAFGPLLTHGGTRGASWWSERSREAGFQVTEVGTSPASLFLLLRRPS